MKIRRILVTAAAAMLLFGCQKQDVSLMPQKADETIVNQDGEKLRSSSLEQGHIRLQLSEEMTELAESDPDAFIQLFAELGVKSISRTFPDAGKFEKRTREAGLHRWYRIEYDESLSLTKAAAGISDLQGVCYAGPVRKKKACGFFNDPMFDKQWGLYNDGSRGASYDKGCDINVVPVWERYGAGDPSVIVAVLDEGVQLDHPDRDFLRQCLLTMYANPYRNKMKTEQ